MKISTKGRYALRTMIDLAMHDQGRQIPLKEISQRQGVTIKYLEQVMNLLNKAGYLRSVRGAGGGYRSPPREYGSYRREHHQYDGGSHLYIVYLLRGT